MENKILKITIIISTYNAAKTLRQTLDSIKYQTYSNIELIVVDGKSTDNTVDIIKEYNDIITKWICEPDTGIYNAWNKALNFVTGDYIAFIGADDCYCNYNVIENIVKNIDKETNVLSSPTLIVDEINKREYLYSNKLTKDDILSGKMLPHAGMFVRTDILQKYRFNEKNRIISDYEFLLQYVLDDGDIKFIDSPSAYFSNGGISTTKFGDNFWKIKICEHILLFEKYSIDKQYLFKFLDERLMLDKFNRISWHIKIIIKFILIKLSLLEFAKIFLNKSSKHKCDLKICRWCGRYEK